MSNYAMFYEKYFGQLKRKTGEVQVSCPFHDHDENPSMSINMETGLYTCFTCGKSGDAYTFYREKHGGSFPIAKKEVDRVLGQHIPEPEPDPQHIRLKIKKDRSQSEALQKKVTAWHNILMNQADRKREYLNDTRGISDEILTKFEIGWDSERYTIPIRDEDNLIVNVRRYMPEARGKTPKMKSLERGQGAARLFPIANLVDGDDILICEGEMDCMLANQLGYSAITVTGGANTWKDEWNVLFSGKDICICYDVDDAGKAGAKHVAHSLFRIASSVRIVTLPLTDRGADITDYFIGHGHGRQDFDILIAKAPEYKPDDEMEAKDFPVKTHLSEARNSKFCGKLCDFNAVVAGKDLAPYLVPRRVKFVCNMQGGRKCAACGIRENNGRKTIEFTSQDPKILQLLDVSDKTVKTLARKKAGIFAECYDATMEVQDYTNVEEVFLTPEIDPGLNEQMYEISRAFYVGHGLVPNQTYSMISLTIPEPKRQYQVHLISEAKPSRDDISAFKITDEVKEKLKIFQCGDDDVEAKLQEIHDDLSTNVTGIYGRNDLLLGIDLVIHSALSFKFQDRYLRKGWIECLILGDTRTGKTETVQSIFNHYQVGELITGENSSFAGLVGGMQQAANRWLITWGKIPLGDRRVIAIDEVSGLSADDIGRMSGIRSSGLAEITKVQTAKTNARTRLIWISNPRENRTLSNYAHGVEAIREIIGKPEDISRFDFCLTCATEEVSTDIINAERHEGREHKYTTELCNSLVLWAWSRDRDQIRIEASASRAILDYAKLMGKEYSSAIPLVEPADQRLKIAKLAVALAIRLFSTKNGEDVIVKSCHVDAVVGFLHEIYAKPSMGYQDFSEVELRNRRKVAENLDAIKEFLSDKQLLRDLFKEHRYVRVKEMTIFLGEDKQVCESWLRFLLINGLIKSSTNGYAKTAEFIKLLRGVI